MSDNDDDCAVRLRKTHSDMHPNVYAIDKSDLSKKNSNDKLKAIDAETDCDSESHVNTDRYKCFPYDLHVPSIRDGMVEEGREILAQKAEEIKLRVIQKGRNVSKRYQEWKVQAYSHLPDWLKDNEFLEHGHRPHLPCVCTCFKSIFKIHTETANIWTHLLGSLIIFVVALYFLFLASHQFAWTEIAVFMTFFICAIICLTFSWLFHTLHCHSNQVNKIFSKLDYSGIAVLIVGSFVPWLYYGFYCHDLSRLIYLLLIITLGIVCIIVSLWDKFAKPFFRPLRAAMYIALGLCGVVPGLHFIFQYGLEQSFKAVGLFWILLMAVLYISGALVYSLRIPERFFPGRCDIWFHSHQFFHVLVVIAALTHYKGIYEMALYRLQIGDCPKEDLFD